MKLCCSPGEDPDYQFNNQHHESPSLRETRYAHEYLYLIIVIITHANQNLSVSLSMYRDGGWCFTGSWPPRPPRPPHPQVKELQMLQTRVRLMFSQYQCLWICSDQVTGLFWVLHLFVFGTKQIFWPVEQKPDDLKWLTLTNIESVSMSVFRGFFPLQIINQV